MDAVDSDQCVTKDGTRRWADNVYLRVTMKDKKGGYGRLIAVLLTIERQLHLKLGGNFAVDSRRHTRCISVACMRCWDQVHRPKQLACEAAKVM